ncbi:hypothetical protein ACWGLB_35340 [Streptomyces sp. NPDC055893]|uniref:hypothetical protein n=1 Tax=Streptomyces sp. MBT42 TaxID=1488373 RepID=UPI001E5939CC|nr:hypothetical protein [Streptomyces sp. MBT42]MCD2463906.1 hypothetical protein [Streptomyces sp. MBT42]
MGRKSTGFAGIVVAAALALGLGATVEAGHEQSRPVGVQVQADDQGPTVIGKGGVVQAGATDDQGPTVIKPRVVQAGATDDQGPTVIGKGGVVQAGATDDQGPTVIKPRVVQAGATDDQGPTVIGKGVPAAGGPSVFAA